MNEQSVKAGDIFYSSWGYDQTNIDFFEVVKVSGAMVTLQKLARETSQDDGCGSMTGKVIPILGKVAVEYPGANPVPVKPIKRKVRVYPSGPCIRIESYATAWPWDGKPKSCSWYA